MAGYRKTHAAEQITGMSAGHARSATSRRQVRDAARAIGAELSDVAAPKRSETRRERKRATFQVRIAAAKTPGQKVSAAVQFLASALAELPAARADQVAMHTVDQLKQLAEQLLKEASTS